MRLEDVLYKPRVAPQRDRAISDADRAAMVARLGRLKNAHQQACETYREVLRRFTEIDAPDSDLQEYCKNDYWLRVLESLKVGDVLPDGAPPEVCELAKALLDLHTTLGPCPKCDNPRCQPGDDCLLMRWSVKRDSVLASVNALLHEMRLKRERYKQLLLNRESLRQLLASTGEAIGAALKACRDQEQRIRDLGSR